MTDTHAHKPEPTANGNGDAEDVRDLVAQADTGARDPDNRAVALVLIVVPLCWSLFQLWYASPLPFVFNFAILNDTEARSIHLAFAIFLAFTAFPAFRRSPRHYIPVSDWIMAALGALSAGYLFLFYDQLAERPGLPTDLDLIAGGIGMVLLLEATRRALGPPLMVVALVFLGYTFLGPYMPDVIAHKGASINKGLSHYWLTTEGAFGIPLGVSTTMVFLFVLFGALLEKAGAGNWFIRVAFSLLGHLRGGPAKAAVVSSGMTGIVSGSSIANVVTTGTFTIPLMKKVGLSPTKAGAVEVAASTNGQLTPPIMGAAAFLMVEYVGISYIDVIKHAILPAAISYVALIYIVHLEALKAGLKSLSRPDPGTAAQQALGVLRGVLTGAATVAVAYYGISWLKTAATGFAVPAIALILIVVYLALLKLAASYPDLDQSDRIDELPHPRPTIRAGLYFLLPVAALIWALVVERLSPGLSAFWATVIMMIVVVTHKPIKAYFRGERNLAPLAREGGVDLFLGLVTGARNMIGIGVATAAAGIVVGTVTLTGIGQVMTALVETVSGGNIVIMLVMTAVISLLLGMGLPTTANYLVVSALMAPVIVEIGTANGLVVPLVAVHMFVFYFGILADDTPPVGLAAFAAAAIAKSDPIRTGLQGFAYDIRTAILPFMFIFNTQLLLIGIGSIFELFLTIASAVTAMLAFAAATQRFFLVRCRIWEILALLAVTFILLRPGFFWDQIYPPLIEAPASTIVERAAETPQGGKLRLTIEGISIEGNDVRKTVLLSFNTPPGDGRERLKAEGLTVSIAGDTVEVAQVDFASQAERIGIEPFFEVTGLLIEADRPDKEWMFLPALILLGAVFFAQRRRLAAAGPGVEARDVR